MKHFSKIVLLALGFALVTVVFFSMHSRAASPSPQASVTGTSGNTLIALSCGNFKVVNSPIVQCDGLKKWNPDGSYDPYTPAAGTALVITDFECSGVPDSAALVTVSCWLGANGILGAQENVTGGRPFELTMHLTSGVTFTGFPGIFMLNVPKSGGPNEAMFNLQGYLIQTSS
jgi:hypothetical protein